jgi:ribosomal protein S18 acetylase RimI-like enzyme
MKNNKITIRKATAADNLLLAEFGRQTFYESFAADNTPENMAAYLNGAFSPEIQARELADPATVFFIAEIDGQTVGYTRMREGASPVTKKDEKSIEIVRIYSKKEFINGGVGAALMTTCLEEASRRGFDSIWLDVWAYNPRAIAFYKKWGFEEVGTQVFQLGDDSQIDILMSRPVRLPEK